MPVLHWVVSLLVDVQKGGSVLRIGGSAGMLCINELDCNVFVGEEPFHIAEDKHIK